MTTLTVDEYRALEPTTKRHKYGVAPRPDRTTPDGIVHHSAAEARRWVELCRLRDACQITELQRQVPYPLIVRATRVGVYVADFTYRDSEGEPIVEDVKGVRTPLYRLKRALMFACLGIVIQEVQA